MPWWLPWQREHNSEREARERLENAERDDARIEHLETRAQRIRRENHLAPWIMKALGMRP